MKGSTSKTILFFLILLFSAQAASAELEANAWPGLLHLATFTVFFSIGTAFLLLMHQHTENYGTCVAFGMVSAAFYILLFAMLASGYTLVITDTNFFIKINYLVEVILLGLATYSSINARNVYLAGKTAQREAQAEEQGY